MILPLEVLASAVLSVVASVEPITQSITVSDTAPEDASDALAAVAAAEFQAIANVSPNPLEPLDEAFSEKVIVPEVH